MATMKQICTTDSTSTVFHNRWEIQQLSCEPGEQLQSEVFCGYSANGSCEVCWHYILEVIESEQEYGFGQFVTRHAVMITTVVDSSNASLKATVELEPEFFHDNKGLYKVYGTTRSGSRFGSIMINIDNYLKFYGKLEGDIETVIFPLKFSLVEEPMPQHSELLDNYSSLLSNEQLSDVTIQVGGKRFFAQKAILSVRSSVFAAMFQSGMQESTQNRIVIEDIEPEVFEAVLRFIYVGKVEGLEKMAHELLAAADKYALDRLRKMCERHLAGNITQETVLKTLALADLYHAGELKDKAVGYICKNIKTMQAADWKAFVDSHPDLVVAILSAMTID